MLQPILSNEILLLLAPLSFFLLVAVLRATKRFHPPMSKVWLTIKVAGFGILLTVLVRYLELPPGFVPYAQEIQGLIALFCLANLAAYLVVELYLHYRMEGHVPSFLRELLLLAVYLFFAATALRMIFNVNMASILTTTTLLTAAFAFAMQNTLSNVIMGFYIQADRNYKRRTWVLVKDKDVSGEIVNVGFRYTTLRTLEDQQVHLPNSYFTQNIVLMIGNCEEGPACINLKVQLDYAFPPERAKAVLLQALKDDPDILSDPAPSVRVDAFMENGIQHNLRFYIEEYGSILKVRDAILKRVWYAVTREGQTIPYPHREILHKESVIPFRMGATDIHASLRRIEILNSLSAEDLEMLARRVTLRVFGDRETVVRQGEAGDSLYIVLCGTLEVYVDGTQVGGLEENEFFGEMSLLTGEKRRATVVAVDEVWLLEISKSAVEPILRSHPVLLENLSRALERRVERTGEAQRLHRESAEAPPQSVDFLQTIKNFFGIS